MASLTTHAPVAAAFRHLATATKVEDALGYIHDHADFVRFFEGLAWDEKVFAVQDEHGLRWAVEVQKKGPTLTLRPTRPDVLERVTEVGGTGFWKGFAAVVEETHPDRHLRPAEGFFGRLLHDRVSDTRLQELSVVRHEEDAVREHRLKMRERQRDRDQQWREAKADENRYMYWLWYQ